MDAKQDCCPEMAGHGESMPHCDEDAKFPHQTCDEQCMSRCMSTNALPSVPLTIALGGLNVTPLPQLKASDHSQAERGPDLRPPINS